MTDPMGESTRGPLTLDFDRRLRLRFRGAVITSDAGLLAYRELDDALGLTACAGEVLADARTGKNGRHALVGMLRQSVFGRLAGYENVNDAEQLCRDPAMRWVVGDRAIQEAAASASQMGRFETEWLTLQENLAALADLSGRWIDGVHRRRPPRIIVLDMDSSESPTYGEQEGSAYNGHFGCTLHGTSVVKTRFTSWLIFSFGSGTSTGRRRSVPFESGGDLWMVHRSMCDDPRGARDWTPSSRRNLAFGGPIADPDHEAAMRFGGEAPRR